MLPAHTPTPSRGPGILPGSTSPHPLSLARSWRYAARGQLPLNRPRLLAILNITPDSFADGGKLLNPHTALLAARDAIANGADALDIGGESTRPGADRIPAQEQLSRILPVIRAIRDAGLTIPISIDTTLAPVAKAALHAGADAINDVSAGLEDPDLFPLAASTGSGLILMHRLLPPNRDQYSDRYDTPPTYPDVLASVRDFLQSRLNAALDAGIHPDSILLDPGLGFGKTPTQSLELIRRNLELATLGRPILSALSRKSFVGRVSLDRESAPSERLPGTLALSTAHLLAGASLFRVHDIPEHRQALNAAWATLHPSTPTASTNQETNTGCHFPPPPPQPV